MRKAIIYGNGPSLITAPLDVLDAPGVARYGVNRSYEYAYAENWVTADARALVARMDWFEKEQPARSDLHLLPHLFRGHDWKFREHLDIWGSAPSSSGPFAMHVAAKQGAEKIYLVGFDWENRRFYEKSTRPEADYRRNYLTSTLREIWEWPKIEWRIWREGWNGAHEILSTEIA